MCWECDHPERTHEDYLEHMQALIDQFGWAIVALKREGSYPAIGYTLGLTSRGRPELVVTGLAPRRAAYLLNAVAPYVLDTAVPRPGEGISLEDGPLMEVVRVAEPTAHLLTAVEFYGAGIQALQLVYADKSGRWPWDAAFRDGQGGQPVLGIRTTSPTASGGARSPFAS